VSNSRAGDVRVEVERERRDGIEYEPLVKRRDRVIVGIDPGTTTAAAVVGLDGTVHALYSSRTSDTADVTEWIIEQGRPIIVAAADVEPMPETVEKFRRSFDAAGWRPTTDLPVDEKLHRTRETNYDNDHERDALAPRCTPTTTTRTSSSASRRRPASARPRGGDRGRRRGRVIRRGRHRGAERGRRERRW